MNLEEWLQTGGGKYCVDTLTEHEVISPETFLDIAFTAGMQHGLEIAKAIVKKKEAAA
jgi:hypothetical protein